MVKKCPYCFEELKERIPKCTHCSQYLIDDLIEVDYHGVEKKGCIFCGKKIVDEARICKYCHKWIDDVERAANDVEHLEDE